MGSYVDFWGSFSLSVGAGIRMAAFPCPVLSCKGRKETGVQVLLGAVWFQDQGPLSGLRKTPACPLCAEGLRGLLSAFHLCISLSLPSALARLPGTFCCGPPVLWWPLEMICCSFRKGRASHCGCGTGTGSSRKLGGEPVHCICPPGPHRARTPDPG